jgi:hypothetical protein
MEEHVVEAGAALGGNRRGRPGRTAARPSAAVTALRACRPPVSAHGEFPHHFSCTPTETGSSHSFCVQVKEEGKAHAPRCDPARLSPTSPSKALCEGSSGRRAEHQVDRAGGSAGGVVRRGGGCGASRPGADGLVGEVGPDLTGLGSLAGGERTEGRPEARDRGPPPRPCGLRNGRFLDRRPAGHHLPAARRAREQSDRAFGLPDDPPISQLRPNGPRRPDGRP